RSAAPPCAASPSRAASTRSTEGLRRFRGPERAMKAKTAVVLGALALAACAAPGRPPWFGFGPQPTLPPPGDGLLPTLNPATAIGWPDSAAPKSPPGFVVTRFAGDLAHPRWLYVLPNGDVLLAESSPVPSKTKGPKDRIGQRVQKRAGALMVSPNRIMLLRDADGDGIAELVRPFAENLKRPTGMVLVGDQLYVALDDALVRLPYRTGDLSASGPPQMVADLP